MPNTGADSGADEFALIRRIAAAQRGSRDDVVLGIGDDGAVLEPLRDAQLVAVCDTLVGGRHFPDDTDPFAVGWKALAVNLSDLAAMGAEPQWALLALTLPERDASWVERFAAGFAALAKMSDVSLVGGDTTRGPLSVTVTALGAVAPGYALTRRGARVGDWVGIAGVLGEAALGLRAVQRGLRGDSRYAQCIGRLDRPEPQLALGRALSGLATACIDVSDGLLADLGHVAQGSGVGIRIECEAVPHPPLELAAALAWSPRELVEAALTFGDDYLLAFTLAEARWPELQARLEPLGLMPARIGIVDEGEGVRVIDRDGAAFATTRRGFNHFGDGDG